MAFLVDTNLVLRSVDLNHPMYPDATNAVNILLSRGEQVCIVPQNLIEFWNVYTRPVNRNGLGNTVAEAQNEVIRLKSFFQLLPDTPEIYPRWESLVSKYQVKGVQVHDAKLVAAMLVHQLTHILTFNVGDFNRYQEIISLHPTQI
ncbi:PIN domain-containing protein [Gloeocapsa sp. PCC 73106]|uniref:type II toxin-antitoxin system VapC family toxin n=1 Tax=Gloeocapsa sp. PCC 73106 TaxID=102232 RepID=UPI0002AC12E7|nr:PIN domain-containing protein [Gloeocapsa sp. PCC 73106]ELR98403.1 putative nucleic acid-binding protein [Gloeocapsa sp. PCC 73106]